MNAPFAAEKKAAVLKRTDIARNGYILISVVFYITGLLHMIWRGASPLLYCIAGGIILIAYGGIKITGYLSDDLYCLAFQYDLGCGLLMEGALNHLVMKDTVCVTKRHGLPDKKEENTEK